MSHGTLRSCHPAMTPACRMTMFGLGNGLLTFHADDTTEIIRIFDITWIG
jgi:hypothetical protein